MAWLRPRFESTQHSQHGSTRRRRSTIAGSDRGTQKGVLLETFSYGLRTAKAGGARFGRKMSDVELRAIDRYGGQILELSPEDRIAIFNATGGHV